MNVVVRQEGESSLAVLFRDPIFQTHNTKVRKYDNYLLGICQPFSDISDVKEESLCLPDSVGRIPGGRQPWIGSKIKVGQ
jgi:hypothetical protein